MGKNLLLLGALGIFWVFGGFWGVWAQEYTEFDLAIRFGPHLACSNSESFIGEVRNRYGESGWSGEDWVPAAIMFKVTDPANYISAGLTAMTDDSGGPRFWPIIRLDGDPHGSRISEEGIGRFKENLGSLGDLGFLGGRPIFIEFANEPNHAEEWGGEINPGDYGEKLEEFISEFKEFGEFRVLNGALDQRAGDTDTTMEAVRFWELGNLGSLGDLGGYAFNNYHFEDSGRYSKEGWKTMRGLFGMDASKPVFLLEFGRDPDIGIGQREDFIEGEYSLDLQGANLAVEGVSAITPLMCVDKDCKKINTAIFNKDGSVSWLESDGQGSCTTDEKAVDKCGEVGDVDDKGAAEKNKCADMVGCPESLRKEGKCGEEIGEIGDIRGIYNQDGEVLGLKEDILKAVCRLPLLDKVFGDLCRWAAHGSRLKGYASPKNLGNIPPDFSIPEISDESKTQARAQAIPGSGVLGTFARKVVAYFVSDEEKGGNLFSYIPNEIAKEIKSEEDPLPPTNLVAGCGKGRGSLLVPYSLCEKYKNKGPGQPLPEGEITPGDPVPVTPGVGERGVLDWAANIKENRAISEEVRKDIIERVLGYWPGSQIDAEWDYVFDRAVEAGWNPAFVIALWIEESGASGVHAWDVGCTGVPQNNLARGLDCLFGLSYTDKPFEEFMCKFSEGHYPCDFTINPNFPRNLHHWYCRVAPDDEGACG